MKKSFKDVGCTYCGAGVGEECIVTLYPEAGPLSISWQHLTREKLALTS